MSALGKIQPECMTISPSFCYIDIHRRSLIRQAQTDWELNSQVHGVQTHDFRIIQRNIEYSTQYGTINRLPRLHADQCKRTGEGANTGASSKQHTTLEW